MIKHADCFFEYKDYKEDIISQIKDCPTLANALVTNIYTGNFKGEGIFGYMITYLDKASGSFVGTEQMNGYLDGKEGTFVLQHVGTFADGKVNDEMTIISGSGTGKLKGLKGSGHYIWEHGMKQIPFTLEYDLE